MKQWTALLVFAILLPAILAARDLQVKVSLEKEEFLIGDWISLDLEIRHPSDVKVFPPQTGEKLGEFHFISLEQISSKQKKGEVTENWRLNIAAYDTGTMVIPPIAIHYKTPADSVLGIALTDSLAVRINSAGGDTLSQIHDIKPPLTIKRAFEDYLPFIFIAALLILAVLGYWVWKKYLRKSAAGAQVASAPEIDPYDRAMRRMVELKNKKLWRKGFVKEYYSEVTEIVREYIEGEFSLPALEMTTEEFLQANLREKIIAQDKIEAFLDEADLVKFAKFIPSSAECEATLEEAYTLLKNARSIAIERKIPVEV